MLTVPLTVTLILRAEGALGLAGSLIAYRWLGGEWGQLALLFLVPDLSMMGYLANRRFGAALYNFGHTTLTPATLMLIGWAGGWDRLYLLALIWFAHIGFDRALGYGLKYSTAFQETHLGWTGRLPKYEWPA